MDSGIRKIEDYVLNYMELRRKYREDNIARFVGERLSDIYEFSPIVTPSYDNGDKKIPRTFRVDGTGIYLDGKNVLEILNIDRFPPIERQEIFVNIMKSLLYFSDNFTEVDIKDIPIKYLNLLDVYELLSFAGEMRRWFLSALLKARDPKVRKNNALRNTIRRCFLNSGCSKSRAVPCTLIASVIELTSSAFHYDQETDSIIVKDIPTEKTVAKVESISNRKYLVLITNSHGQKTRMFVKVGELQSTLEKIRETRSVNKLFA